LATVARTFDVDLVLARRKPFRMLDFRFVVMIEKRRGAAVDPAAAGRQSSFGRHSGQRDKRDKRKQSGSPKIARTSLPVDL
jgi:hypothetical protein